MSAPVGTGRALGVMQSVAEFDQITTTTGSKLGFYGVTPTAQLSGATQTTITATWVAISSGFGFLTSDQVVSVIAAIQQIQYALKTLGLWKGSA